MVDVMPTEPGAMGQKISVALIEDNRLVREGITALLHRLPDLAVVAGGSNGDMVLLRAVAPQVVLLDLGLRNGDSLRLAERIRKEFAGSRIIVMDLFPAHEELMDLVNAGVSGFILKDANVEDLAKTIRLVAQGKNVLPRAMTETLFSQIARYAVTRARPKTLDAVRMTPREREVIRLVGDGLSNKEIAGRLRVATRTVKSHVRNVMEKLTLHSRLQIAAYAQRGEAI